MPRVSVLLPSYNHAEFIEEAISSVLGQTFGDLELVIVDDGSSDASVDRIMGFSDSRIVTYVQPNLGAHAALNKAIELSSQSSDYIAILNSDDAYAPERLEEFVELLDAHPEFGFGAGLVEIVGENRERIREWYAHALRTYRESEQLEQALLHANFILTTSNVVCRRRLLLRAGGFVPLRYVHDLDFLLRLSSVGRLGFVEKELVRYRIHGGNTIAGTRRDRRRMIYELGWILADRIQHYLSAAHTPDEIQDYASGLVGCLPTRMDFQRIGWGEIAAVATVLLPLRFAAEAGHHEDPAATYYSLSLLEEDHSAFKAVHALLEKETAWHAWRAETQAALDREVAWRTEAQAALEKEVAWRAETQAALEKEVAWRTETQAALEKEVVWRTETQAALEKEVAWRAEMHKHWLRETASTLESAAAQPFWRYRALRARLASLDASLKKEVTP